MMLLAAPLAMPFVQFGYVRTRDLNGCYLFFLVPFWILVWVEAARVLTQLINRLAVHRQRLMAEDVEAGTE
jgi:hypothetical protein